MLLPNGCAPSRPPLLRGRSPGRRPAFGGASAVCSRFISAPRAASPPGAAGPLAPCRGRCGWPLRRPPPWPRGSARPSLGAGCSPGAARCGSLGPARALCGGARPVPPGLGSCGPVSACCGPPLRVGAGLARSLRALAPGRPSPGPPPPARPSGAAAPSLLPPGGVGGGGGCAALVRLSPPAAPGRGGLGRGRGLRLRRWLRLAALGRQRWSATWPQLLPGLAAALSSSPGISRQGLWFMRPAALPHLLAGKKERHGLLPCLSLAPIPSPMQLAGRTWPGTAGNSWHRPWLLPCPHG